jgi:hypothetical protein
MDYRFLRQTVITPADLGLNGVALNSEKTSSTFSISGCREVAVYVNYTYAAGTAVTVELDMTPEEGSVSNWYKQQSVSVAAGTGTLSSYVASKAAGAASQKFEIRFTELNGKQARIRIVATGAPTASDTAIVTAVTAA